MNDTVGIFVSHKSEDEPVARRIRNILASGSGQIRGFISSEIEPGQEWFKKIKDSILESKILLLLLIKPRADWDWPLLEAGLAVDLKDESLRRVVCLHHPDITPPAPLRNWQTVPADDRKLTEFLKRLYGDANYIGTREELNGALASDPESLAEMSRKISLLFSCDKIVPWFPHNRMVVSLEHASRPGEVDEALLTELRETRRLPAAAPIRKASDVLMQQVFGIRKDVYSWRDICERSAELRHTGWLKDVGQAAHAATKCQINVHIPRTIRGLRGDVIYRPVLYRTEFVGDKPLEFQFLFTEEVRPGDIAGSGQLGQLYRMLSLAHRFRSEVLDRFNGHGTDETLQPSLQAVGVDPREQCQRLIEVIGLIEKEAADLGLFDPEILIAPFDDDEVKQELLQLLTEWHQEIKLPMIGAAEAADVPMLLVLLERLKEINSRFMAVCGSRYAELAGEEADKLNVARSKKTKPAD